MNGLDLPADNIVLLGFLASFAASMGTVVGAAMIFSVRTLSEKLEDMMLSGAAGIMLAATFFSLILPALEVAEGVTGSRVSATLIVIGGILTGAVGLWLIHTYAPHEHFHVGREGPVTTKLRRVWLFVIAITLHNFPEGMAVGVGFAGGNVGNGASLAMGIGLQNIPEGLAVAASLLAVQYNRLFAFGLASATGLVEPLGGAIGAGAVWAAEPLMPFILGMAAGAMLFIISDEIIPETHRRGFQTQATFALMGGFAVMMFLDATLG